MRLGEDFEFYARALALGARFLLVPAQGYVSVIRANSLSGCHTIDDLRRLRDCTESLALLPSLLRADHNALTRFARSVDCRLQWRLLIEAVKSRQLSAAAATFLRPHPVPMYLLGQLLEQAYLRLGRRLISPRSD